MDMNVNVDRARQYDDVSRYTRLMLCLPHNNLHNIRVRNQQQQQQQQQQGTGAQQQRTISTIQCRTHLTRIFSLSQDATRFLVFSVFLVFVSLLCFPSFFSSLWHSNLFVNIPFALHNIAHKISNSFSLYFYYTRSPAHGRSGPQSFLTPPTAHKWLPHAHCICCQLLCLRVCVWVRVCVAFFCLFYCLLSCQPNTRALPSVRLVLRAAVAGEIREETAENPFVRTRPGVEAERASEWARERESARVKAHGVKACESCTWVARIVVAYEVNTRWDSIEASPLSAVCVCITWVYMCACVRELNNIWVCVRFAFCLCIKQRAFISNLARAKKPAA